MKIALLISGGVDSAVACYQLVSHGYIPDLWYIKIGADEDETLTCTAEEDIEMATSVAHKFGLKLNIIDLHNEYWDKVVGYTMDHVRHGLTPNPDVMCNQFIKFGAFIDKIGHQYDRIATGHYGCIYRGIFKNGEFIGEKETLDNFTTITGKPWLGRAMDDIKDQTDFLCTLNDYQMSKIMLPLGNLTKDEVRQIASEQHLAPAKRKDSQGICFLGKINYNEYIERYLGKKQGDVIDINTLNVLGQHNGYWFHTIGQRKGLGFSGGPWYVINKDIENNIIYVTNNQDDLTAHCLNINSDTLRWFNDFNVSNLICYPVNVRIRHTAQPTEGILEYNNDKIKININNNDIVGAAPGQFCVIYDINTGIVLGSGEIGYEKN